MFHSELTLCSDQVEKSFKKSEILRDRFFIFYARLEKQVAPGGRGRGGRENLQQQKKGIKTQTAFDNPGLLVG